MEMVITKRKAKHLAKDRRKMVGTETGLIKTGVIVTGLMRIKKIEDTRSRRVDTITIPCTRILQPSQNLYMRYSTRSKGRIRIFYHLHLP